MPSLLRIPWISRGWTPAGHSTGKGQFSFQSQRKAMPKNTQTTAQLCQGPALADPGYSKWGWRRQPT